MGAAAVDPLRSLLTDLARLPDATFGAPERLWMAAPLLLVLALAPLVRRARTQAAGLPFVLRGAALLALLAVLLEPRVEEETRREGRLVVLADVSPSVAAAGIAEAEAYLAGAGPPLELIAFGAAPRPAERLEPDPREATDLAAALRFATARAAGRGPTRVVLLSDGRPTAPGSVDAALHLRREAELVAVGIPSRGPDAPAPLAALGLDLPEQISTGTPFSLRTRVRAGGATRATALLFVNGERRAAKQVELAEGESTVAFERLQLPPGRHHVQVILEGDRTPLDNAASATVVVAGVPRVLVLAAKRRRSLVADALALQGMEIDVAAAAGERDLDPFDAVILLPDASASDLEARATALAEFVGRRGGGLVAIGGSEGPGLARLHGTPTAFLLPLEVEPRPRPEPAPPAEKPAEEPRIKIVEKKTQAYPITLCLVVDRSGSMADGDKLRRAKQAAAAAALALTPDDRLATVAFAEQAEVILSAQPAGDGKRVLEALASLQAGGSTAMFKGLEVGYALLEREKTPIRHLILLSDGMERMGGGPWRTLVTSMAGKKITTSTLSIGWQTDRRLLANISRWGKGRYWPANHPHEIPQVVTQDTMRIVSDRNRRGEDAERTAPKPGPEPEPEPKPEPAPPRPPPTVPIVAERGAPREMLRGVKDGELPEVAGAEEGKPRFAAWVAARAGREGPPLLAYWRVGLGTAAALTLDPEATGAVRLREHPEFARLMAQLVRSVLPDAPRAPVAIQEELVDANRLRLRLLGEDGRPRTDLDVTVALDGVPSGVIRRGDCYEVQLPRRAGPGKVDVSVQTLLRRSFAVPASPVAERLAGGADRAMLMRLTGASDRLDLPAARALARPVQIGSSSRPLSLPFLLIAAILLPFDAWARRKSRFGSR